MRKNGKPVCCTIWLVDDGVGVNWDEDEMLDGESAGRAN